jgi:hypothetical protein
MLAGIGTCVGAGAVIYAAHKGADTFKEWRKQKHHERCMAVAEEVLTLAYSLKRAFDAIRSPAIFGGEMAELIQSLRTNGLVEEGQEPPSSLTTAQAALSRVQYNRPLFEALLDKITVAKAVFGDDVANAMQVFWGQRVKVVTSAHAYASERQPPPGTDAWERYRERREKLENILWDGGDADGEDEVSTEIDRAVATLEAELLPIIRNKAD